MFRRLAKRKRTYAEFRIDRDLETLPECGLSRETAENVRTIRSELGDSSDIVFREFRIGGRIPAAIVYTDGLVNEDSVSDFLMGSLMRLRDPDVMPQPGSDGGRLLRTIKERLLTFGDIREIANWKQLYPKLLFGDAILFIEGSAKALAVATKGGQERGVEEPSTQTVIRGPRESFTESIRTNTSLIRRKIRSPKLWLEERMIGEVTMTTVGIMYIKGIANEDILGEVRRRLDGIRIDGILESGYIEDLIQDEVWTPFPTVYNSERPDVIAGGLLEGRVAILVEGTPFVLMVPVVLDSFLQSAEDYYQRYDFATFIRMLRFVSFLIALLFPSLYVAVVTYHQEVLPTSLMLNLAAQRENVPFPPIVEAFVMEVIFEILREAGLRMPKAVGNTISIVGALIIGQAAVEAGIVSSAMVIVVALTAITNFVIPSLSFAIAIRLLRFVFLVLAGTLGMYGIAVGLLMMVLHLASLRSFGVPYLKPFAPFAPSGLKDAVFRFPLWSMNRRPAFLSRDRFRQGPNQKPDKPPGERPGEGGA